MFLDFSIYKQILIFSLYVFLSFGVTMFINTILKPKLFFTFIVPGVLLIVTIILLIIGLIPSIEEHETYLQNCILSLFAFIGFLEATLLYCFTPRKY